MPRTSTLVIAATGLFLASPGGAWGQVRSDVQIWSQSCSNCHTNQPARRYTDDQWPTIIVHMKIMARLTDDEADAVLRYLGRGARKPGPGADEAVALASGASSDAAGPVRWAGERSGGLLREAPSGPFPDIDAVGVQPGGGATARVWENHQTVPDGKTLFDKECASCHGQQGRGNGRAGRDLDPRPTDISNPEFLATRTDEELLKVIADGKGEMTGIGANYGQDAMKAILAYVRSLGERRKK